MTTSEALRPDSSSARAAAGPRGLLPDAAYARASGAWRLLEESLVQFAERGYHGVSVRDITGAVGMKAQSAYAHFASKEDILYALVDLGMEAHREAVRDVLLASGSTAADQLRVAVQAHVRFHIRYPLLAIVGNNELHALSPGRQAEVFERRRDIGVLFIAVIERGMTSGEFSCNDAWIPFSAIAGMTLRLGWWYRSPELADMSSTRDDYPRETSRYLNPALADPERMVKEYAEIALRIVGSRTLADPH